MNLKTLLLTLLLFPACAPSDSGAIVDDGDKEDGSNVMAADPGYVKFGLVCPTDTGCRGTLTFDFAQVGADPADVSVLTGRTESDLKPAGSVIVNGDAELVVEIDEATTGAFHESSSAHNPNEKILVVVQLADENPVEYQLTT